MNEQEIRTYLENKFPFSINKEQLYHDQGIHRTEPVWKALPYYGLFRSDTDEPVSNITVKEGYIPHQTRHIVDIACKISNQFGSHGYETDRVKAYFKNGHYVTIEPNTDYRKRVYHTKTDYYWPRILIQAGLGGQSVRINIGYWRDACSNMAMPKEVQTISINYRHCSPIEERLENLDIANVLYSTWNQLKDMIEGMAINKVNLTYTLTNIFGDPTPRGHKRALLRNETIIKRLIKERTETTNPDRHSHTNFTKATAWEMYNAIQGYYQHDAPMRTAPRQAHYPGELTNKFKWERMLSTMNYIHVIDTEQFLTSVA